MTTSRLIAIAVLTAAVPAAALFPAYAAYGPRTGAPTVQAPGAAGGRTDCLYGKQPAADTYSVSFGCRVDA
ncbi:hypothetical protein OG905_23065 [Streptomyces sp. NBC_00322]|uniref:hypothetical protein n=1 Tax=Streptomyces sp. NBC_00322 TaxID=2975712 RepID=UPI002E2C627F|nr:hypothetical protein [Streptomyces sp. NBC_00322]